MYKNIFIFTEIYLFRQMDFFFFIQAKRIVHMEQDHLATFFIYCFSSILRF